MNKLLLHFYHRLPTSLRSVAATLRGYHLRSWYYGPESERLVAEALDREQWSDERWKSWQEERLAFVLHRAATRVPYYRAQWEARRRHGDKASWEVLQNWPILEKEALRENPRSFIADDCDVRRMFHDHTSGTTGKPIECWSSRETLRSLYALQEARIKRWYGVSRRDRWARIGGQLVAPVRQRKPPFWVWNTALKQLYMSSYHLAPDLIATYLDALQRYRIRYLLGYTSSIYELAIGALRLGRHDLRLSVVITYAEPVSDYQRSIIAAVFQCEVRETYGMVEAVASASECPAGTLHIWPEVGHIEVIGADGPVSRGNSAAVVSTGLLNADMPLIRYRTGDSGSFMSEDVFCNCGRTLPLLAGLEGRVDDVLYTTDGRRIGRVNLGQVLQEQPVIEGQIIQETSDRLRVRLVPAPGFTPEAENIITERLQARMGKVNVILEKVDQVPRGANGKFRAVLNQLSVEERRHLEQSMR